MSKTAKERVLDVYHDAYCAKCTVWMTTFYIAVPNIGRISVDRISELLAWESAASKIDNEKTHNQ